MDQPISNIQLQFHCPAAWDQMQPADNGRYCTQCSKTVFDFTDAKQAEFLKILAEQGGNLCGRFSAAQMAPQFATLHGWKRWASAALVLLGINVFQQRAYAQGAPRPSVAKHPQKTKAPTKQQQASVQHEEVTIGVFIEMSAGFPGGQESMKKYLSKNIRYKPGMVSGTVMLHASVERDGSLSDINIISGVNDVDNEEALRVVKAMPKWRPSISNGRSFTESVTIPVVFEVK